MTKVFADTYYFLALLNPRDRAHEAADRYDGAGGTLVTSWFVLIEVADALCRPPWRSAFSTLLATLQERPDVVLLGPDTDLLTRAADLYASRPDKAWSLTDCTSFIAMADQGITDALTADRHFEQAGFRTLM